MTDFEHNESFVADQQPSAGLGLDRYHSYYRQMLATALEDGVITAEERAQLDLAVETLGLDRDRMTGLEHALQTAYRDSHPAAAGESERTPQADDTDEAASSTTSPSAPSKTEDLAALQQRVVELEQVVRDLHAELERARDQRRSTSSSAHAR